MENYIYTYMLHYNSETTYKLHTILSLFFREIYQDVYLCGMLRLVQKISELFILFIPLEMFLFRQKI